MRPDDPVTWRQFMILSWVLSAVFVISMVVSWLLVRLDPLGLLVP